MSHIHIPDGVIPISWWLSGFILTAIILYFVIKNISQEEVKRKIPFIGIIAALMLLAMSVPLGILPFHLNLTVLMGILAGPGMAFIAIFAVNIFLAFFGHGGITLIGINTLLIGFESLIGYKLFYWLSKRIQTKYSVIGATIITLLLSTTLMLGIIVASGAGFDYVIPQCNHDDNEIEPVIIGQHETSYDNEHHGHFHYLIDDVHFYFITGWAAVGTILFVGILLEALVISIIFAFILKVKPDIIDLKK